ncbi:MAG TPA: hypothetical protein VF902_01335, partial [Coriobacteriia bacterium]
DPAGLALVEESYITSGGAKTVARTVTHAHDASGRETLVTPSDGKQSKTTYDAKGDVYREWVPGAELSGTAEAATTVTNADGQQLSSTEPTMASATTGYTPDGEVLSEDPADADATTFGYDAAGNQNSVTSPSEAGTVTATTDYDLGGRITHSVDTSGNVTDYTHDLLGRCTAVNLSTAGRASSTTYNTLGWVLTSTDPDGVVIANTYDKVGRVLSRNVTVTGVTATTGHVFDSAGREKTTTNPDGSSVETTYNAFGRVTERTERAASGQVAHQVASTYDELGRPTASTDVAAGTSSTSRYTTSSDGMSTLTLKTGDATTTIISDAAGLEFSRSLVAGTGGAARTVAANVGLLGRDEAQRLETLGIVIDQGAPFSLCETYDKGGHIIAENLMSQGNRGSASYPYNPSSGRKTGETVTVRFGAGVTRTSAFGYTLDGRLASSIVDGVQTAYGYDPAGQITSAGSLTLAYALTGGYLASTNANGGTTYTYERGRRKTVVSATTSSTLDWNLSDRLTAYRLDRNRDGIVDVSATFTYDASGQRTLSVVASGSVVTTTTYTYSGLALQRMTSSSTGTGTTTLDF